MDDGSRLRFVRLVDVSSPLIQAQPGSHVHRLRTVDLSKYEDGEDARKALAEEIRLAMTTQGFFKIINHGLTEEDISRQVDVGHTILNRTRHEEKQKLKAPMVEEGSYRGSKPRGEWRDGKSEVRDKSRTSTSIAT